jgi:type II secretory pathway pseudopilin PulG
MKRHGTKPRSNRAPRFTLVELIAVLILLSVTGAVFATFIQGLVRSSAAAPLQVQLANDLLATMEKISDDYDNTPSFRTDLSVFKAHLETDPSPYGDTFDLVQCRYVKFVDNQEQVWSEGDPEDRCLKVVIANQASMLAGVFPEGDS